MMEPEQLGDLMNRHLAALVLYARQWCAVPEDVVQEAFIKLAGVARSPASPTAWLYRVVRNGAVSAARAQRRRASREAAAARAGRWFADADPATREAADALAGLPLEQREVIVAHVWGGLTFAEIGDLAGTSAATAHRRYAEGLAALRNQLGVSCPPNRSTPN